MKPSLPSAGDFNQLRAFVAVAGSLNFSRAAENLGVSSSALSQMVRGLEERVGVSLFNRTTRSVSLTEAGAKLFERVQPAVEELAEALGVIDGQLAEVSSNLASGDLHRLATQQRYLELKYKDDGAA